MEMLLKLHGVSRASPSAEVAAILEAARYSQKDISDSLSNVPLPTPSASYISGLHKVIRTDANLQPSEVSSLLGIEVQIDESMVRTHRDRSTSAPQLLLILALSVFIAMGTLIYAMYEHRVGPFHPTTPVSAFFK